MKLVKHLKERGMDPSLYLYSKNYSANTVTFYLFNMKGDMIGYQQYRPNVNEKKKNDPKHGRYFTYLPRETIGVFGLETLDPNDRTIYIVEGIFKAAVLHRLGFNSIAVLTSTPKHMKPWFKILRQTWNLVAIGDNDDAGKKFINYIKKGFQSPIDLDEMKDEEILELLKNNS